MVGNGGFFGAEIAKSPSSSILTLLVHVKNRIMSTKLLRKKDSKYLLTSLSIWPACAEAPLEGCQGCQLTPLEFWRLAQLIPISVCPSVKNLIDTPT